MENEHGKASSAYSLALVFGLLGVIALGLVGLPMTTIIPFTFAAALAGALLYGLRSPA